MAPEEAKVSRQRILDTAITLFAQRGFDAVGVREIARQADVNIAMISYYFDGKVGILEAIMARFFEAYAEILADIEDHSQTPEESVQQLIRRFVELVRSEPELAMVTYNELPLDVPEIAELKARRLSQLIPKINSLIARFGLEPDDTVLVSAIGPSLIGMIFGNLRTRPVLRHLFDLEFDDTYYERYIEVITTLFLDGIHGIVAEQRERREQENHS